MAGLRGLLDDPAVLAADSFAHGVLARAAKVAVSRAPAGVAGDVGGCGAGHGSVEKAGLLSKHLDVASGARSVRAGHLALCALGGALQRGATERDSGNAGRGNGTAPGDHGYPRARAASGVPGASVRDAGVERGHGACRVLLADGFCNGHGRNHDSRGGCGAGEEIRGGVSGISGVRAGDCSTAWARGRPSIIRLGRTEIPAPEGALINGALRRKVRPVTKPWVLS